MNIGFPVTWRGAGAAHDRRPVTILGERIADDEPSMSPERPEPRMIVHDQQGPFHRPMLAPMPLRIHQGQP